jgi:hypothetical protein
MMKHVRMSFVLAALVALSASSALAQSFTAINASPLKIHVGADGSYQVYNSSVPGVGQVFPTGSELADMGVFARIDGVLYAPDFKSRGTATGAGLTDYVAWQKISISPQPIGSGSPDSPFAVSVVLAAPNTDVRVNVTTSYVRGNSFFRIRTHIYTTTGRRPHVDAFLGADIYLASSDNGIFLSVPQLNAVGGRNCNAADGVYNILLIPITTADRFTAAHYADVWRQIQANELDNNTIGDACIDNGAAIQWLDVMRDSDSVEMSTAVSFGEVPSAANFHGFMLKVEPDFVALSPGESVHLKVTSRHNAELEFNSPITFSATDLPPGLTMTFSPATVPAPGDGTVNATLTLGPDVYPQIYRDLRLYGTGGNEIRAGLFTVNVLCTPPYILGLPTSQPQSQVVANGTRATLKVKPEGGGIYTYQWYAGHAPLIGSPIANSNSATFETPPVTELRQYWVRVSNQCGSVNSLTATVSPSGMSSFAPRTHSID